jgi:histidinol-phosphate aminotransferase
MLAPDLERVVHGSVSAAELEPFGLTPADVLDFSVNTNPLGPAPGVLQAIRDADWTRYPGDDEAPLRSALARRAGLGDAAGVALGNGSSELLWLVCLAVLRPGEPVAILGPTFGEYARAARATGGRVTVTTDGLAPARLAFVCNPNNPSGAYCRLEFIRELLADARRVLVLDEAYAPFVDDRWPSQALLEAHPNLVILRSLTKDQALPGLRLGYLLAAPELARAAEAVRPPWSVNAGALRAGLAALTPAAEAHVVRARAVVATSRDLLTRGFSRRGFRVWPSQANFVLVEVGDGGAFRRSLLPRGLVVRDCASFGLPGHVRVACRRPEECQRLLDALP